MVREVESDVSNGSDGGVGLTEDDPPITEISQGIISSKRIGELVPRYKVPPDYICRILGDDECQHLILFRISYGKLLSRCGII